MKYQLNNLQGKHYQSLVLDSDFWQGYSEKFLAGGERICVDRIRAIFNEIGQLGEDCNDTLLDIGCNIGLFTFVAQNEGLKATGVENDIHTNVKKFTGLSSIDTAKKLVDIYKLYPTFIEGDYITMLDKQWDYVLYLSVWHHHLLGYGHTDFQRMEVVEAEKKLAQVWQATKRVMYFEIDGFINGVVNAGWGQENIAKNLLRVCGVKPIEISSSLDGWKHPRTIFKLQKI